MSFVDYVKERLSIVKSYFKDYLEITKHDGLDPSGRNLLESEFESTNTPKVKNKVNRFRRRRSRKRKELEKVIQR